LQKKFIIKDDHISTFSNAPQSEDDLGKGGDFRKDKALKSSCNDVEGLSKGRDGNQLWLIANSHTLVIIRHNLKI